MINFVRMKARVAAVVQEIKDGGDLAKMYAENLDEIHKCSVEDDEEYETLREIEFCLIMKIVETYMEQNGYRKNERGRYAKE